MTELSKDLINLNLIDTFGCPVDIYVPSDDAIRIIKALKLVGFRKITPEDVFYFTEHLEKLEAEGFDYEAIFNDPTIEHDDSCFYRIYEREPIIEPFDRDNPRPFE